MSRLSRDSEAKQTEKDLLMLHCYVLDAALLLITPSEELERGTLQPTDVTDVTEITRDTLCLVGNAIGQASKLQRRRILQVYNLDIALLVDQENIL